MDRLADVVIVGGGIAGGALATVLARDGRDVVLLERQVTYRDKVRGEVLVCWGVEELLRLGLEQPLLDAGGSYATAGVHYDEVVDPADAETTAAPMGTLIPGVPGVLDVGHPQACAALTQAAGVAGATVVRGAGEVGIELGPAPSVRWLQDGSEHTVTCRLVVGADGRHSAVRRQLGMTLHQTTPRTMGGGMLVDGLDSWPASRVSLGTEGDLHYLIFPRAYGRVRLYLVHGVAQRGRFAGPDRQSAFLRAYRLACIPGSEAISAATPAGPCAFYPMNDSWVDQPAVPGCVLIGDAAGWNDPIIGQGLSIALRDVRIVADIVRSGSDWSVRAFAGYCAERRERMRRLQVAAALRTDLFATFTPEGAARRRAWLPMRQDPVLGGCSLAPQIGPERVPAEAFLPDTVDRLLALT